jgi:hypothetical protein
MVKIRKFTTNRFTVYYHDSYGEVLEYFNNLLSGSDKFGNMHPQQRFSEAIRRLIKRAVKEHMLKRRLEEMEKEKQEKERDKKIKEDDERLKELKEDLGKEDEEETD